MRDRVLVVDDEQGILDLYSAFLRDEFDVITASSASEAIDILDESVAVITLDRRMPDASGDQVADEIRSNGYDCPIIFVTGVSRTESEVPACDAYLEKPISRDELVHAVTAAISDASD